MFYNCKGPVPEKKDNQTNKKQTIGACLCLVFTQITAIYKLGRSRVINPILDFRKPFGNLENDFF